PLHVCCREPEPPASDDCTHGSRRDARRPGRLRRPRHAGDAGAAVGEGPRGAAANSRGYRHEENVNRLAQVAQEMPLPVGAALLASADGYTPRANTALDHAREELGTISEIANALADNLPLPKLTARKSRRRRRKRKSTAPADGAPVVEATDASPQDEGRTVEAEADVPADVEDAA